MLQLQVISVSTRPGRKGPAVAKWFQAAAAKLTKLHRWAVALKTLR